MISARPAPGSNTSRSGSRPIVEGGGAYSQPNQSFRFKTAWSIPIMTQSEVKAKLPGERVPTTPVTVKGNPAANVVDPVLRGSTVRFPAASSKKAKPQKPGAGAAPPR